MAFATQAPRCHGDTDASDSSEPRASPEPPVTHMPSSIEQDVVIKLNLRNCSVAQFKDCQKAVVLWDSGASLSLISKDTIRNCGYLNSLPQNESEALRFKVGNGTYLIANKTIKFDLLVQGQIFSVTAYITPTLGGFDVIIGTNALRELEAKLCFKTSTIRFKSKGVIAKLTRNGILKPGEVRVLNIRARMPDLIKNSEVYFKATRFMSKFIPANIIIRLNKGQSKIIIRNNTR